jgi:2'-5' RNA ligase
MNTRLFTAIELPAELGQQIEQVMAAYQARLPKGVVRWVKPHGLHITARFYGDTPAHLIPDLQGGLARVAQASASFMLTVEGLGVFPNPRKPQVLWVGVGGETAALERAHQMLEAEALQLGFKPDDKAFSPHFTLGRVNANVKPADLQTLLDFLAQTRLAKIGEFRADSLSLMQSQLRPGGSVYTQLFNAKFGK